MKLLAPFFGLFLVGSLSAQIDAELETGQTNYPIGNVADAELETAFMNAFQPSNVGNMHVYAYSGAQPDAEYFFAGETLGTEMRTLFSNRTKRTIGTNPSYAVAKIRGGAAQYYLLRYQNKRGNPTLGLFDLRDGTVDPLLTLASADCRKGTSCQQTDSWIQDVDGDTRLDVIQKMGTVRDGEVRRERMRVYQQREDGSFRRNRSLEREVDGTTYQMELLK